MGRHRHVVNVRADGIAVVLGPLLRDERILAAALVDVDSGMVLDAWSAGGTTTDSPPDLELIGAQHAEIVRNALELLRGWPAAGGSPGTCEVVLGADGGCRHLLRTLPDPHGDRLALAVVVNGPQRVLDRVRKRMQAVSVDALTAGPSMTRRPSEAGWSFDTPGPDVPAHPDPYAGLSPASPAGSGAVRPSPVARPFVGARSGAEPVIEPVVVPAPRRLGAEHAPVLHAPGRQADGPRSAPRPTPGRRSPGPTSSGAPASVDDRARPPSPPAALPAPAPPRVPRP